MIPGIFGEGSVYHTLRGGLNDDLQVTRQVADRIANAVNGDAGAAGNGDFQAAMAAAGEEQVNLEAEMGSLVDAVIRYDAESRLLREAYSRLRTAIGGNRG